MLRRKIAKFFISSASLRSIFSHRLLEKKGRYIKRKADIIMIPASCVF